MVTSKHASKRSALQVIPGGAKERARNEPTDEEIVEAVGKRRNGREHGEEHWEESSHGCRDDTHG
jgi:hypothetical protein